MNLDASLSLSHRNSSQPRHAVDPLVWTLTALVACTPAADDDDSDLADSSSSTVALDTDPSSSSEADSTTPDAGQETTADGCWDQQGELDGFDGEYQYPFEAFACAELPLPCEHVIVLFDSELSCDAEDPFDLETLWDPEAVEASARCVLAALRDGAPATHRVQLKWFTEERNSAYTVLDDKVIAFQEERQDNYGHASNQYVQLRDTAWFDACLAEDLGGLLACFLCDSPVEATVCIGETPACP